MPFRLTKEEKTAIGVILALAAIALLGYLLF
jgi:hypothetical protein